MRMDDNGAYGRGEDEKRKWNYRYTMVTIIGVLLVTAAAMVVWNNDADRIARDGDRRDINRNNGERNFIIGDSGKDVAQPIPTVDSKDRPAPSNDKQSKSKEKIKSPVEGGTISKGYSGNDLVYSATLDQYTVHLGVDIEAAPDTPVKAVKSGTVTKVYNDDKLGITIEISHGSGYVTRYSNLSTDRMVGEGDVVEAGDVISGVGITALFESSDPPHLHFEVLQDGIQIDPLKFVSLE
jgi:murein DD-endopeptidase MepM/ murein hydrolase activator NlpD